MKTEITDKEFCRIHNGFFGEDVDNPKQIVKIVFTGEDLKEYVEHVISASLKVAEAKQIPTNNVTEIKIGDFFTYEEDEIIRKCDSFKTEFDKEYIVSNGIGHLKSMCSLSSPEKQEAKQLPEVKDWDEVFSEYIDFNRKNKSTFVHLLDWLKQNYLLPSEQTPLKEKAN